MYPLVYLVHRIGGVLIIVTLAVSSTRSWMRSRGGAPRAPFDGRLLAAGVVLLRLQVAAGLVLALALGRYANMRLLAAHGAAGAAALVAVELTATWSHRAPPRFRAVFAGLAMALVLALVATTIASENH